jgi:hypothetical protein
MSDLWLACGHLRYFVFLSNAAEDKLGHHHDARDLTFVLAHIRRFGSATCSMST